MKRSLKSVLMALALIVAASGFNGYAAPEGAAPPTAQINTGVGAPESPNTILPAREGAWAGRMAGDEQATIQITPAPGPSELSPNFQAWLLNFEKYLETGFFAGGDRATDPKVLALPSYLNWYDIVQSTATALWMAILNPPQGALANERGNGTYYGVAVERAQGFRLSNLRVTLKGSDTSTQNPNGSLYAVSWFNNINYSQVAVGIQWKDGVKGRAGAVRVTSGQPNQLVNQLFFTGFGNNYRVNTQEGLDNARLYILQWADQGQPFKVWATYDLFGDAGELLATATKEWSTVPTTNPPTAKPFSIALVTSGAEGEEQWLQSAPTINGPWKNLAKVKNPAQGGINIVTLTPGDDAQYYRKAP